MSGSMGLPSLCVGEGLHPFASPLPTLFPFLSTPFPSGSQKMCSHQDVSTAGCSFRSPLLVPSKLKFISQGGNEGVGFFFSSSLMGPDEGNECGGRDQIYDPPLAGSERSGGSLHPQRGQLGTVCFII